MRFVFSMAGRELRASWRRLAFFFVCVAVGVSAIVALRSVIQQVGVAMAGETRALLAADVLLESEQPWSEAARTTIDGMLDAEPGLARTLSIEMATMARPADEAKPAARVVELRAEPNPAFPGMAQPEPIARNLAELCRRAPAVGASVGLALDGDADRIGLVDETGRFVSTLEVFSLLAHYLLERGDRGPLVKGVTASVMLNKLAARYGVAIAELPVGFKNIGPRFVADNALLGGEESGGYAFRGHIPERDGILSGLYLLEYMASSGLTASGMVRRLFDAVGEHHYQRRDIAFDPSQRDAIRQRLAGSPLSKLAGMPVRGADDIDGRRWIFDAGWVAARFSGTEPLLRIYCEADTAANVTRLLDAMQAQLGV